ncbi:MAG: CPBP family intramembrane metalloprotease [Acidobacteriia bacterium]|nr:CPBP family intramembrane metalloprotease [Terriglobia bacterium]
MTENNRNLFPGEPPEAPEPAPHSAESASLEGASVAGPISGPAKPAVPEDLRVPWDWLDLLLFGLFVFATTIVFGLLLLAVGRSILHLTPAQLQKSRGAWGLVQIAAQVVLDLVLLGYLAAQMRMKFHAPFWRTIGWRSLETTTSPRALAYLTLVLSGFLLAVVTMAAETAFPPKHALPIETVLQDPRAAALFMLTAVLVAPLVEETLFRGYLYPVLARSWGVGAGVFVTGTLFGLLHSIQLWGGWWQIALLIAVGIVFTLVRARTGTVLASFIVHISYNSLQVITTLVALHGLRHLTPVK